MKSDIHFSKFLNLTCFLVLSVCVQNAFSGVTVGNGGDAVYCEKSSASSFEGYYSFDYLMTLKKDNSDLVNWHSWSEAREGLLSLFAEKDPDMERLFRDFVSRVPGEDPVSPDQVFLQQRVWLEAIYGLIDIEDEGAIRKLPPNCYKRGSEENHLKLIQAVIRQKNESAIIYNYDPDVLEELRSTPLQYSFLLVHEWLWDYLDDPEAIRRINRFIHSKDSASLSPIDFQNSLKNLGFRLHPRNFVSVCQRTPAIEDTIVQTLRKSCESITEEDVLHAGGSFQPSGVAFLDSDGRGDAVKVYLEKFSNKNEDPQIKGSFVGRGITSLFPGDLTGLEIHTDISFHSNSIDYLFRDSFYGFLNLMSLDLSLNRLREFSGEVLDNSPNLIVLNLSNNSLEDLSQTGSRVLDQLRLLVANDNQISSFPDLKDRYPNLQVLGLRNNRISQLPDELFLAELQLLDLRENQFTIVPIIKTAQNRFTLALQNNQISELGGHVIDFLWLSGAHSVNLYGNQINELSTDEFAKIVRLGPGQIDLRYNGIQRLPTVDSATADTIIHSKRFYLSLQGNPLSDFDLSCLEPLCQACERLNIRFDFFNKERGNGTLDLGKAIETIDQDALVEFRKNCYCKFDI